MATIYKQKLLGEINAIPENLLPRFFRIIHTLRTELTQQAAEKRTRGSLRGIWGRIDIDEEHISAAKESMFPYEDKGTR